MNEHPRYPFHFAAMANGKNRNVCLGYRAGATNNGDSNTFIGAQTDASPATVNYSIAIGRAARVTADHQAVIGGDNIYGYVTDVYFGRGVSSASPPATVTINATSAASGNTDGSDLVLAGGTSSGSGADGIVKANGDFEVSGETKTEVLEITGGADLSERFHVNSHSARRSNMVALLLKHGASE